ncbi:MAG: hypothetical protein AAFR51_18500 [Pseudomonadota bacterium]
MTGPISTRARLLAPNEDLCRQATSAARFVKTMTAQPVRECITNAHSEFKLLEFAGHYWPITIENNQLGNTYVASPHSAYVLYARDEIDILNLKGARHLGAKVALAGLDRWLKALAINRTVHIDNWMLSTNLHGNWEGAGLPQIRQAVTQAFPKHLLIIRNVDPWSCPQLLESLRADGWTLLPSRQIWVTDDLENNWKPRSHTKSDRRALRRSDLEIEDLVSVGEQDAQRIADLYTQLYLGRYSALNPSYSARFVQQAYQSGALQWRVARNAEGTIMASAGMRVAGDIVTVPMLGYDMQRPQSEALYRIASLLSADWAHERGFRHHGSSGAGEFKSNRGARSVIEYMAVYTGHLPMARRQGIKALSATLNRTMVPALQKHGW